MPSKFERYSYAQHGEDWKGASCKGLTGKQSPIALPHPHELVYHSTIPHDVRSGYTGPGYAWGGSETFVYNYDMTSEAGGPSSSYGYVVGDDDFGWRGSVGLSVTPADRDDWLGKLWFRGREYVAKSVRIRGPAEHFYIPSKVRYPLEVQIIHKLVDQYPPYSPPSPSSSSSPYYNDPYTPPYDGEYSGGYASVAEFDDYSEYENEMWGFEERKKRVERSYEKAEEVVDDVVILSLFIEEGKPNSVLEKIIKASPHPKPLMTHTRRYVPDLTLSLRKLIGDGPLIAYSYSGSLTSPPCEERVHWFVVGMGFEASENQIKRLRWLLETKETKAGHGSWRYTQNLYNSSPITLRAATGKRQPIYHHHKHHQPRSSHSDQKPRVSFQPQIYDEQY